MIKFNNYDSSSTLGNTFMSVMDDTLKKKEPFFKEPGLWTQDEVDTVMKDIRLEWDPDAKRNKQKKLDDFYKINYPGEGKEKPIPTIESPILTKDGFDMKEAIGWLGKDLGKWPGRVLPTETETIKTIQQSINKKNEERMFLQAQQANQEGGLFIPKLKEDGVFGPRTGEAVVGELKNQGVAGLTQEIASALGGIPYIGEFLGSKIGQEILNIGAGELFDEVGEKIGLGKNKFDVAGAAGQLLTAGMSDFGGSGEGKSAEIGAKSGMQIQSKSQPRTDA